MGSQGLTADCRLVAVWQCPGSGVVFGRCGAEEGTLNDFTVEEGSTQIGSDFLSLESPPLHACHFPFNLSRTWPSFFISPTRFLSANSFPSPFASWPLRADKNRPSGQHSVAVPYLATTCQITPQNDGTQSAIGFKFFIVDASA